VPSRHCRCWTSPGWRSSRWPFRVGLVAILELFDSGVRGGELFAQRLVGPALVLERGHAVFAELLVAFASGIRLWVGLRRLRLRRLSAARFGTGLDGADADEIPPFPMHCVFSLWFPWPSHRVPAPTPSRCR